MTILKACHICCSFMAIDQIRILSVESPSWLWLSYVFLKFLSVFGLVFFVNKASPTFMHLVDSKCN